MAVNAQTGATILVNDLDASQWVTSVSATLSRAVVNTSSYGSNAYDNFIPGMKTGHVTLEGWQDLAVNAFYESINAADMNASSLISLIPGVAPAAGDASCLAFGTIEELPAPIHGNVGEANAFTLSQVPGTIIASGPVLHPVATRTTTANGTAVAYQGPSATQTLYAGLHVTSGSGGTLTVKVQSDNASGFPSSTDRITFTATTGRTFELKSVAGDFSTETHLRAQWTVSAGTFTFAVVVAVVSNF
jgi:hypothetical protein